MWRNNEDLSKSIVFAGFSCVFSVLFKEIIANRARSLWQRTKVSLKKAVWALSSAVVEAFSVDGTMPESVKNLVGGHIVPIEDGDAYDSSQSAPSF